MTSQSIMCFNFRPTSKTVKLSRPAQTLILEKGKIVTGVLLDAETAYPLSGQK